jgi:hypothetical protein
MSGLAEVAGAIVFLLMVAAGCGALLALGRPRRAPTNH